MQCEMCGADFPRLKRARVEGTVMSVCNQCVRFGEELAPERSTGTASGHDSVADRLAARERRATQSNVLDKMDLELVEDFGERIRKAREKKGWTREQLADRIQQPVPTVTKFESQALHPADATIKVLERELGIKLMEQVPQSTIPQKASPGMNRGLTLGDLIKEAKEKKK